MRIHEIIVTHTRHKILQILTRQCNSHSFPFLCTKVFRNPGDLPPFHLRVALRVRHLPGALGFRFMLALHNLFHLNLDSRRYGDDAALRLRFEQRNHIALCPARRLNDPRSRRHGFVDFPAGRLEFNLWGKCDLLAALFPRRISSV